MQVWDKLIYSGAVLERERYQLFRGGGIKSRRPNTRFSTDRQRKLNTINSKKKLTRLINSNFVPGDLFVTLTYDSEFYPADIEKADRDLENYFRRIKYALEKAGIKSLKYVAVTGRGSKRGRIHHHFIVPAMGLEILRSRWKRGNVKIKPLKNYRDYTGLALYLYNHYTTGKRWKQSHYLKRPKPKKKIMKRHFCPDTRPHVPKGYRLIEENTQCNDITGILQYFKYIRLDS